jgi:hypothetical protein
MFSNVFLKIDLCFLDVWTKPYHGDVNPLGFSWNLLEDEEADVGLTHGAILKQWKWNKPHPIKFYSWVVGDLGFLWALNCHLWSSGVVSITKRGGSFTIGNLSR